MNDDNRFVRNELFFGEEGQRRIRATNCTIVGIGGLGTHVVQQLALLGVRGLTLVEPEDLTTDNRNRYIGAWHTDPVPGSPKVEIAKRLVELIDPTIDVQIVPESFVSDAGYAAIRSGQYVFGCVDNEGSRLLLTEACSAHAKPYIDLATDIDPKSQPMHYGGRVHFAKDAESCLVCMDVLDKSEAGRDLESAEMCQNRDAVYGIDRDALGEAGPSVVSINGVVASLAVTEFMVHVTGVRPPCRLLQYYAHSGKVTVSGDAPHDDCYYCKGLWGTGAAANVERYFRSNPGEQ